MLDTNALSELIRKPAGPLTQRVAHVGTERICTSVVVACELRFGARRRRSATLTARVEQLLEAIAVLPFDVPADEHCADIRADLERAGTPIGSHDPGARPLCGGLAGLTCRTKVPTRKPLHRRAQKGQRASLLRSWPSSFLAPRPGLEPGTYGLTVRIFNVRRWLPQSKKVILRQCFGTYDVRGDSS
ncbi:MAG: PIN domain-containing protein [Betaproteobacteria bacterium]